jgi:transposase
MKESNTNLVKDRDRVKNRIQKTLEDGNVKLGTIASDVFGKSGLQVLRTIAEDCTDASVLSSRKFDT